ncbi:MAG TPA: dTDP-glucose 4,6-dehydratase [Gemmatimonadales bacterium]|nr:dTDP-glucose 4,6-dehydratase [Gemmatimonadales bacterium]
MTIERVIVTGGAGFIGTAVVRQLLDRRVAVLSLDALTYAASPEAVDGDAIPAGYRLEAGDVRDSADVARVLTDFQPDGVIHLAAESHVDRSIDGPRAFLETNVTGTFVVLETVTSWWRELGGPSRERFRLVHVSTDEVFGSLEPDDPPFTAETPYRPRSPYSASKAAADHFARAWHETYGLPVIVTNCSNNFGPWQFPEKFIPVVISRALAWEPIPIYGAGDQVRDWLHVEDHASGLLAALERGAPGSTYLFGARNEWSNRALAELICDLLDGMVPDKRGARRKLLENVTDRPGHDSRYAIDPSLAERELGWEPRHTFTDALRDTIRWYVDHRSWAEDRLAKLGGYRRRGLGESA